MLQSLWRLGRDKDGVTMIEFAMIAALVSIVALSFLRVMGTKVKNLYSTINSALATA